MADLARLSSARFGVLGTISPDGEPHMVPATFALTDGRIVTAIDWKPKQGSTLQRISNIERDPRVTFLAHHYSEDWEALWWVRVDGRAEIHREGSAWEQAIDALVAKYDQYRTRPPDGAAIVITPEGIRSWAAVR
jgi:PPOX class probable F420-dependent enzyme